MTPEDRIAYMEHSNRKDAPTMTDRLIYQLDPDKTPLHLFNRPFAERLAADLNEDAAENDPPLEKWYYEVIPSARPEEDEPGNQYADTAAIAIFDESAYHVGYL